MKKIIGLFAAVLLLSAGFAFAAGGVGTFGTTYSDPDESGNLAFTATGVGTGVVFNVKASANVHVSLQGNDGTGYVVASYHSSGSKAYATGSGDSRIYMKDKGTATTFPTPPTIAATVDWTGWTAVK